MSTILDFFGGFWVKAAAVLILLGVVSVTAYRMGGNSARADLNAFIAKSAQQAQQAELEQRAIETKRQAVANEVLNHANEQLNQAKADAATATAASNKLRDRIAALVASSKTGGNSGTTGTGAGVESASAADLLGNVLVRLEPDARSIAAYADELKVAGQACEAAYDSLDAK